jgi:hypothetical protein
VYSEDIITLDIVENLSVTFAIFKERVDVKKALAVGTIAIEDQNLSLEEPSNEYCSKLGIWRRSHASSEAKPAEARSPKPPTAWPSSYDPNLRVDQSHIWNVPTSSRGAIADPPELIISTLPTIAPDASIVIKTSQALKPQVVASSVGVSSSIGVSSSPSGPQSHPTTQTSNFADPAATNALHSETLVTTGIAGQVTPSTGTESQQQDLNYRSATITTISSKATIPNTLQTSQGFQVTNSLTPPSHVDGAGCASQALAAGVQTLPPSHLTLGTAPPVASSVFSAPRSNVSSSMAPSAVSLGTVQGYVPSHHHQTVSAFPMNPPVLSQDPQTLSTISSSQGGGCLNSNAALSLTTPFSYPQQSLSDPIQHSVFNLPPSHVPESTQQGSLNSHHQNALGPPLVHPLAATPVHSQPSVSGDRWMGGIQAAIANNIPPNQVPIGNPPSLHLLPHITGSSVDQSGSETVTLTEEQVWTAQTKFSELYKAHEEVMNERFKVAEELENEKKQSDELRRQLEFLQAGADARVELSRQPELERQLEDSWARERTCPELVKAFLLLEGMARTSEGLHATWETRSTGPDAAQNTEKGGSLNTPARGGAKRQRLQ